MNKPDVHWIARILLVAILLTLGVLSTTLAFANSSNEKDLSITVSGGNAAAVNQQASDKHCCDGLQGNPCQVCGAQAIDSQLLIIHLPLRLTKISPARILFSLDELTFHLLEPPKVVSS